MKTVTVKVWKLVNGEKIPSTTRLQVNEKIADMVESIFDEIYYDPEHFPINISETGGYDWRYETVDENGKVIKKGTTLGTFSEHTHGIAIDVNYGDNPYFVNGVQQTGRSYEPGKNPYAITKDSSIYKIFKKYGWQWGGDWNSSKDYMHFQWYGNGDS